jgi:hypothetical protein
VWSFYAATWRRIVKKKKELRLWGGLTLKGTLSLGFTGCDGERRGQDRGEEREERRPKSNRTGETSEALVANGLVCVGPWTLNPVQIITNP